MKNYDIKYEILEYKKFYDRLNNIVNNPENKYEVKKLKPLGQTKCGFDIEHYSIGSGPMHVVYMGCAHGNEIISTDYVTQLMANIALGNGAYQDFDPNVFTLDFIPCQNPEGFFTTTYALNSVMKDMTDKEIEAFSKKYWASYREDDINVTSINSIIRFFCEEFALSVATDNLIKLFWKSSINQEITMDYLISFLETNCHIERQAIENIVEEKWQEKLKGKNVIPAKKLHHQMFEGITLDCIPAIDEKHIRLKEALTKMYSTGKFPLETLANFFSNASGVNLNDNNEYYYNELKERVSKEGTVYANLRDNNLSKSIPGPVGMPSASLEEPFEYAPENKALLDFLAQQDKKNENYAFFNIHGTGGLFYLYPVFEDDLEQAHKEGVTRDFTFLINNRLATEYTRAIGREYEEKTGTNSPYKTMGYPDRVTGVGDLLRKTYTSSFILELSKMGGNPIAPYGDREGNYNLTMTSNMRANNHLLKTILTISHLYESSYTMSYYEEGKVHYGETARRK